MEYFKRKILTGLLLGTFLLDLAYADLRVGDNEELEAYHQMVSESIWGLLLQIETVKPGSLQQVPFDLKAEVSAERSKSATGESVELAFKDATAGFSFLAYQTARRGTGISKEVSLSAQRRLDASIQRLSSAEISDQETLRVGLRILKDLTRSLETVATASKASEEEKELISREAHRARLIAQTVDVALGV